MSDDVTDRDRATAQQLWEMPGWTVDAIAAALAAERERVLGPVRALAEELQNAADRSSEIVGRLPLRDAANRIRNAIEETR